MTLVAIGPSQPGSFFIDDFRPQSSRERHALGLGLGHAFPVSRIEDAWLPKDVR